MNISNTFDRVLKTLKISQTYSNLPVSHWLRIRNWLQKSVSISSVRVSAVCAFTLKSMPTVEMKLPARKAPSLKCTRRQVFPTPESPTSITWDTHGQKENGGKLQMHNTNTHTLHKLPSTEETEHYTHHRSRLYRPILQRYRELSPIGHHETQNCSHFKMQCTGYI